MDGGTPVSCAILIRGGLVFDGSGLAPSKSDVLIEDGRISEIGDSLAAPAHAEVVEAAGKWVIPGLLDIHTHFDLEVEIEPQLPEALRHGTTTVLVANCSLGLAFGNQRKGGADPIVDCFARVENVPKSVLKKVADVATWSDSGEYIEHLRTLSLGPNIIPMIPHSMLRIEVMGLNDSVRRHPTDHERARMGALLEKAMKEGYVGFSTDALPFHFLANQPNTDKQIPTQFAKFDEIKYLTNILRKWNRVWQATPPKDSPPAVLKTFSLTSGRLHGKPLRLIAVAALDLHMNRMLVRLVLFISRLMNSSLLNGKFRLQALAAPFRTWSDGAITPLAEEIPVLRQLNELDLDDQQGRMALMNDPGWVAEFRKMWWSGKRGFNLARLKYWLRLDDNVLSRDLRDMQFDDGPVDDWNGQTFQWLFERLHRFQKGGLPETGNDEKEFFESCAQGIDEADFVLALLKKFDLALRWTTVTANRDPAMVKRLLFHPLLLPGFNDSGAHLTNMAFYDANLRNLKIAEEDGEQRVAEAVKRLTKEPAEFLGIEAGQLTPGARADVVMIDPEKLRQWEPEQTYEFAWRECFEHRQMVNRPEGVVEAVWVAGKKVWQEGRFPDAVGREAFGRVLLDQEHERLQNQTVPASA